APARATGRTESESRGHDRDGMDAAGFLLRTLHARVQRHRPTGHLAPAALERGPASGRSADSGAFWRRGDAAPPGRAARAGASVGRKAASDTRGCLKYPVSSISV